MPKDLLDDYVGENEILDNIFKNHAHEYEGTNPVEDE